MLSARLEADKTKKKGAEPGDLRPCRPWGAGGMCPIGVAV